MRWVLGCIFLLVRLGFSTEPECNCFFSPKDQLADRLVELIDREEEKIRIAAYCLTHVGIAKALIAAQERKVHVEVLVDPFSIKAKSSIHRLLEAGIPVYVWDKELCLGNRKGLRRMHDKFCLFGDSTVWTGSFDFTNDANLRHRENAIVIESASLAQKFSDQFSHMKGYEARPFAEYARLHPKKKRKNQAKKSSSVYPEKRSSEVKK